MAEDQIRVEVAYAKPDAQLIIVVILPAGATAEEAIIKSGITSQFAEIDLAQAKIGIFSHPCSLTQVLKENDRVEIYRPLLNDPKQARRNRAAKQ